jgi:hypothetical protein
MQIPKIVQDEGHDTNLKVMILAGLVFGGLILFLQLSGAAK